MLRNGLGTMIRDEASKAERIVDLFTGAGWVAWYAAENTGLPVLAVDLQEYAAVLARSVVCRTGALAGALLVAEWLTPAATAFGEDERWEAAQQLDSPLRRSIKKRVLDTRALCSKGDVAAYPVWSAYGGHYFSATQSLKFDVLRRLVPVDEPRHSACLAALIWAASKCVASPGHTAQPFQPTPAAGQFISLAWAQDPVVLCEKALAEICPRHASVTGEAVVSDALDIAKGLGDVDLVVVDPPYSGVQYSRFYHVLETVARGECGPVSGAGRYPEREARPQSDYSLKGKSLQALESLLEALAGAGTTVIFTFPEGECSNGLSGELLTSTAGKWFRVDDARNVVTGVFSTLGGNNGQRAARHESRELLLLMRPR